MKYKLLLLSLLAILLISCSKDDEATPIPEPEPTPEPVPEKIADKVYEGDITLGTQDYVNSFGKANYTIIKGEVWVSSANITDLTPISHLRKVEGNLYISGTQLKSLEGLKNLDTVTEDLNINYNHEIKNLNGLDNLIYIGNNLNVSNNHNLQNFEGLGEVEKLITFYIHENASLKSLLGMESIGKVTYYGSVYNNPDLSDLCALQNILQNLEQPDVEWTISGNAYNPTQEEIASGDCKN